MTDDKPFLGSFVTIGSFGLTFGHTNVLAASAAIGVLFYTLVVWLMATRKRLALSLADKRSFLHLSGFFFCVGFGFVALEIAAIQKGMLFLGSVPYATAAVLGSSLVFGGLGSFITLLAAEKNLKSWIGCCALLFALSLFFIVILIWRAGYDIFPLPFGARTAIVVASIALPAALAGVFFPLGMRAATRLGIHLVPIMWAFDGFAGVIGGISARAVSFDIGITATFLLVAIAYLAAWVFFMRATNVQRYVERGSVSAEADV